MYSFAQMILWIIFGKISGTKSAKAKFYFLTLSYFSALGWILIFTSCDATEVLPLLSVLKSSIIVAFSLLGIYSLKKIFYSIGAFLLLIVYLPVLLIAAILKPVLKLLPKKSSSKSPKKRSSKPTANTESSEENQSSSNNGSSANAVHDSPPANVPLPNGNGNGNGNEVLPPGDFSYRTSSDSLLGAQQDNKIPSNFEL